MKGRSMLGRLNPAGWGSKVTRMEEAWRETNGALHSWKMRGHLHSRQEEQRRADLQQGETKGKAALTSETEKKAIR